jgi:integrase
MSAIVGYSRLQEHGLRHGQIMARTVNRLSALKVSRLQKKGLHADGAGLYLRVATGGSKNWIFRYALHGSTHDMGLGSVNALSLADAREEAAGARKLLAQGIDPIKRRDAERASQRVASTRAMTFKQCGEAYIASHEAGWTSPKHRSQWRNTLEQHVYPTLGSLQVSEIDTALVMKVIEPLWRTTTETASRVRGRMESILDWAKVSGYRIGENPARWRGHLDHLLPARSKVREVEHLAAMPYADVAKFMQAVRQHKSPVARALEFIILTAARVSEVLGATRDEIDMTEKVWTIAGGRMKAGKEHRVPLTGRAMAILRQMHAVRRGAYVFPGAREGRPISGGGLLTLAKEISGADITAHGFRSSFRDWAAERTNYPNHVVEMALAHAIPGAVEAAYRRGDLFEKRRKLMDAWAEFCAKPSLSGTIVPIGVAMK